ncbi:hypothetical protein CDV31_009262 [Fusarium ambrosium]|uniref:Uncharacterized protein n=1 Tax=Fusarium ambrosium TaxID=131363 RepID=A0A428TVV4_9HYPO|nr:hypothetical protein CDV31_009262 [Fusarium ambrosium]
MVIHLRRGNEVMSPWAICKGNSLTRALPPFWVGIYVYRQIGNVSELQSHMRTVIIRFLLVFMRVRGMIVDVVLG